ncbi:MAG: RagB/SusD family nutrient uptake outer membrane protein, partial [Marinoscillum sp.]
MRKSILFIALCGSCLCGCEDFLTEDLQGTYSNSTFYRTADHAELALTGIYNVVSFSDVRNNLWVFGDVASDDAVKGGQPGDQNDIQFIDDFTYQPSNAYLNNIWKHYYEGITRANYLVASLPQIEMEQTRKDEIRGEALFLRSYFYFHLVNIFGELPLKLKPPLTSDQIHVPLSSIESVYTQIDEDLEVAASVLQNERNGRVSAGAAWGLLAKSKLYQGAYQEVLSAIEELEATGSYGLTTRYTDNFT